GGSCKGLRPPAKLGPWPSCDISVRAERGPEQIRREREAETLPGSAPDRGRCPQAPPTVCWASASAKIRAGARAPNPAHSAWFVTTAPLMDFLAWHNILFLSALTVSVLIVIGAALGLELGDADIDAEPEIDAEVDFDGGGKGLLSVL